MKKLERNQIRNLKGGIADPDEAKCSITCDAGKFACCSAGLCTCIVNGTEGTTCTKGGPGNSTCKI
jgi:hypothetical protein